MTDLRGLVAVVLAAGVAICVVSLSLGIAVTTGPISQEDSALLSTVLGAAIGAVATYLGGRAVTAPRSAPPVETPSSDIRGYAIPPDVTPPADPPGPDPE